MIIVIFKIIVIAFKLCYEQCLYRIWQNNYSCGLMKAIKSPNHLYSGLYDSHCHLFFLAKKGLDIATILQQYYGEGLSSLLNIVLEPDEESWDWHLSIAQQSYQQRQWPKIRLAVGIHPNDADGSSASRYPQRNQTKDFVKEVLEPGLELVAQRVRCPEVVAIGETGLDYYRNEQDKDLQQQSLEFHIALAQQYQKTLIIHNRDSDEDIQQILCHRDLPAGGIMHCFSGNIMLLESLLDKGFYFSFAGNVTYKNAENLREAVCQVPLERLLIETDAPFLAPQPVRGQINHPGFIGYTLDVLAQCHNMASNVMLQYLRQNWLQLFPVFSS